ncbi:hypothetical protein [Streptomyces avicenniae]|uniref:hypothetical protein n=1 Tax=Streptomyces avicenniae TaxID=500153 RepID=UPI00069A2F0A|nr:hypothetical protein [Streptomyces avicenniae]
MTITADPLTPDRFDALLTDATVPVVHRALWALLWETDIRVLDLLALDVTDAAPDGRRIRPGAPPLGPRAAALLAELVGARESGPLFAVGRAAERLLTWEEAVRVATGRGLAIHTLRATGKAYRPRED